MRLFYLVRKQVEKISGRHASKERKSYEATVEEDYTSQTEAFQYLSDKYHEQCVTNDAEIVMRITYQDSHVGTFKYIKQSHQFTFTLEPSMIDWQFYLQEILPRVLKTDLDIPLEDRFENMPGKKRILFYHIEGLFTNERMPLPHRGHLEYAYRLARAMYAASQSADTKAALNAADMAKQALIENVTTQIISSPDLEPSQKLLM